MSRVLCAMSGGVDSSVAAALLVEQGHEVIGVTMNTWGEVHPDFVLNEHSGCCSLSAVEDARAVANQLGIPYYVFNFQGHFAETVVDYFLEEYTHGRTPNPCIACNRHVKFAAFLDRARQLECEYIATGHYAVTGEDAAFPGRRLLGKSADPGKDQTYVLYNLTQDALAHTMFPIGHLHKSETRRIAARLGLHVVADKPDSQEICFVLDQDYARFVTERRPEAAQPGPLLSTGGEILGEHRGLPYYTIGQRRGIGLAAGKPLYVVDIDPERNAVIVGDDPEVLRSELIANDLNWIALTGLEAPRHCTAKIRSAGREAACRIEPLPGGQVRVRFDGPVRAPAPGQAVVFYAGPWVLGGGTIRRT